MKLLPLIALATPLVLAGCHDGKTNAPVPAPPVPVPAADSAAPTARYLTNAQPRLQSMKLFVGDQELIAELALKPVELATGMMWRTNMAENEAMLFVFVYPHQASFYMKNTRVPLSAAYIDPEGAIAEIHDLHPTNEVPVEATATNIQYVLEVPQGWFKRHNVVTGSVIRSPHGALKDTFTFHSPK